MVRRQLDVQIGSPRGGRAVIDREGENCIEQAGGSPGMSQDREETGALGIPPFSDYRGGPSQTTEAQEPKVPYLSFLDEPFALKEVPVSGVSRSLP